MNEKRYDTLSLAQLLLGKDSPAPGARVLVWWSSVTVHEMPLSSIVLLRNLLQVDIAISRAVDGVRLVLSQGLDRAVSQWNQARKSSASASMA